MIATCASIHGIKKLSSYLVVRPYRYIQLIFARGNIGKLNRRICQHLNQVCKFHEVACIYDNKVEVLRKFYVRVKRDG